MKGITSYYPVSDMVIGWLALVGCAVMSSRVGGGKRRTLHKLGCPAEIGKVLKRAKEIASLASDAQTLFGPFVQRTPVRLQDAKKFHATFPTSTANFALRYAAEQAQYVAKTTDVLKMRKSLSKFRSLLPFSQRFRLLSGLKSAGKYEDPDVALYLQMANIAQEEQSLADAALARSQNQQELGMQQAGHNSVEEKNWNTHDIQVLKKHYEVVFEANKQIKDIGLQHRCDRAATLAWTVTGLVHGALAIRACAYSEWIVATSHSISVVIAHEVCKQLHDPHMAKLQIELYKNHCVRDFRMLCIREHPTDPDDQWFKAVMPSGEVALSTMSIDTAVDLAKEAVHKEGEDKFRNLAEFVASETG
jgi:hypothetical protein